ncbi:MAG: hypothetical protein SAK29_06030 [Scytonema sp. PMC 1069.18]|nr:hypothetical protein [Scytonema sp. PMC 1069.18]MEC4881735.1 hypothetical protein [Scytonema sp. PMC 1070.18]
MDGNELPLAELFTKLREAGLSIGIDEYNSVLSALQGGFGVSDRKALKRLCQTIWVKSAQEKQVFEHHFEQVMGIEVDVPTSDALVILSWRRYLPSTRHGILGSLSVGIVMGVRSSSHEETLITKPPATSGIVSAKATIIGRQTVTLIPTPTEKTQPITDNQSNVILWVLLPLIVLGSGYVVVRRLLETRFIQKNLLQRLRETRFLQRNRVSEDTNETTPQSQPQQDEVQTAKAVLATSQEEEISKHRFLLTGEYFPVTARQMKQMWRYLRRPVRQGSHTELDVEATVNHIGQQGLLLEPVMRPSRVNSAEMLLLIDQDGSMVPFDMLSRWLAQTALRGGRLGKAGIYYFHNCPIEYLYHDPNHLQAVLVSDVVTCVCSERTAVLIFSDAGAARSGYSEQRFEFTKKFLDQLKQQIRYIAWLNPMPRSRWEKTTAGDIASLVPMFEVSRRGLQDAIGVLRGRPTNFEGRKL